MLLTGDIVVLSASQVRRRGSCSCCGGVFPPGLGCFLSRGPSPSQFRAKDMLPTSRWIAGRKLKLVPVCLGARFRQDN